MKHLIRTFLFAACVFTSVFTSYAQQPAKAEEPKTKLESFQAKTGVVIIKGYSTVGRLTGQYGGGSVEVQSREFKDATSGLSIFGVTLTVKEGGRLETEERSFIDYDEIDSLIKGLDYVSKIDKSVTSLSSFEASYRTKGGLMITTFSDSSTGGVNAAVTSGRADVFIKLEDLVKLRQLLIDAKSQLDAIRQK